VVARLCGPGRAQNEMRRVIHAILRLSTTQL
jgi:hypothetical protein